MPAFGAFFYSQLFITLPYPTQDQSGKTVIVTGSNVGLGLEAARHFTRLNASKVILAVRSVDKGEAAKKSIEETTGRSGVVEVWQLDLSSYESVKQFAERASALPRLDVLLENAGIATDNFRVAEADESTITVNVVSTFLLALLLLPKLKESSKKHNIRPLLTIVSSEVHGWSKFDERKASDIFATLSDKSTANMKERYPTSKLLEVFVCREIAKQNPQPAYPVTINFVNPGLCHSELGRDAGWFLFFLKLLLARTTEAGSRTLFHAANAGSDSHGQYMSDCAVAEVAPLVLSEEGAVAQKRVWEELGQKLEKIQPGVLKNI